MESAPDISTLIRTAISGDRSAFDRLIEPHRRAIFAYIRRMVGNAMDAEDLTQEVLLKVHQNLAGFRGESAFLTWLYRIARNHVRDYFSSRSVRARKREKSLETLRESPVSTLSAPDADASEEELRSQYESSLSALDFHLKEAYILRHQEGLSYHQIAVVLEISVSNAKIRVHRARDRIFETLRERGYDL